jgi:hypothetical protein
MKAESHRFSPWVVLGALLLSLPAASAQSFDSQGKLDPFVNLDQLRRQEEPQVFVQELPPMVARPPGLAGLAISEVLVTGLAVGEGSKIAILRGTDNFTYLARENARLFDGFLARITDEEVIFVQEKKDPRGQVEQVELRKRLFTEED